MVTSKAMKAEMLEPDIELELARNWHQRGCEKSLHRLVNAYMRLAVSMASKYVRYGIDTNELIQEAGIGLMKAAEKFDPERGEIFNICIMVDQGINTGFCAEKLVAS